jgi:hypothetical protein
MIKKSPTLKRQKRPYLLLELMIAFSLLSICALPLVRNPLSLLRKQINAIEDAEIAREAHFAFAEFKARLYQNKDTGITWEQVSKVAPKKREKREPDFQEVVDLYLPKKRQFVKKIFLWKLDKDQDEDLRLMKVRISLSQKKGKKNKAHTFDWVVLARQEGS